MSKLSLNSAGTGYLATATINDNFQDISDAFENTLSRDGTDPNSMEAPLDMNSNRILNLPAPVGPSDPVRYIDLQNAVVEGAPTPGSVYTLGTRTTITSSTIPSTVQYLVTNGYATVGDGGQGVFTRSTTPHAIPLASPRSADGAYWIYQPDNRGVNAKAFGAIADGTFNFANNAMAGTDNHGAIQAAIDYGTYYTLTSVYLLKGSYRISSELCVGYGTNFRTARFEGDGSTYTGDSSYAGTTIYCDFFAGNGISVQGARNSSVKGLTLVGKNFTWIQSGALGTTAFSQSAAQAYRVSRGQAALIDDKVLANWIDPAAPATANGRYTAYCGIAVDPRSGAAPSPAYPDIAYPSFLGTMPQYNKAFSSAVTFDDISVYGFVVRLGSHICQDGSQGDFIHDTNAKSAYCVYGRSFCGTQGRNFYAENDGFNNMHTLMVNSVHGVQQGRYDGVIVNPHWSSCIKWFDLVSVAAGSMTIEGAFGEELYQIGNWRAAGASEHTLRLIISSASFSSQSDVRGYPAYIINADAPIELDVGQQNLFKNVYSCKGSASNFSIKSGQLLPRGDDTAWTDESGWLFANATYGGWMFNPSGSYPFPSTFLPSAENTYNVDSGSSGPSKLSQSYPSTRSNTIPFWCTVAHPQNVFTQAARRPNAWRAIGVGFSTTVTLVNGLLTMDHPDFSSVIDPGQKGDCIVDPLTGTTFLIASRSGTVITATQLNNYVVSGGVKTPIDTISLVSGNWYMGNTRHYCSIYATFGTISTSANTNQITSAGRSDTYAGYINGELKVGDKIVQNDLGDSWNSDSTVFAIDASGTPITLNGTNSKNATLRYFPFFMRKPPA